ncbi:hypothetical protein HK096_002714 [Nowakowskiella sp. JEL0078]|nr:hypothetical protein HK096_002714 [Nowakowskiella sp. JEL0078]
MCNLTSHFFPFLVIWFSLNSITRADLEPVPDFLQQSSPSDLYDMTTSSLFLKRFAIFIGGVDPANDSLASNLTLYLDLATSPPVWYLPKSQPQFPQITGHAAVVVGTRILLLFGTSSYQANLQLKDPVAWFDPSTSIYSVIATTGLKTGVVRVGHTAVYHSSSNAVFVYGGVDGNNALVTDLWILSLNSMSWKTSPIPKYATTGLVGASSVIIGNDTMLTCFGTQDSSIAPTNKCYVYNITLSIWANASISNSNATLPSPRSASTMTLLPSGDVLLYGGGNFANDVSFSDVYILNTSQLNYTWIKVNLTDGEQPDPSFDYGSVSIDGYLVVWGGRSKVMPDANSKGTFGIFNVTSFSTTKKLIFSKTYTVPDSIKINNTVKSSSGVIEFVINNPVLSIALGVVLLLLMIFTASFMIIRIARHRREAKNSQDYLPRPALATTSTTKSNTSQSRNFWFGMPSNSKGLEIENEPLPPLPMQMKHNRNSVYSILESSSTRPNSVVVLSAVTDIKSASSSPILSKQQAPLKLHHMSSLSLASYVTSDSEDESEYSDYTGSENSFRAELRLNVEKGGLGLRISPLKPTSSNEVVDGPMVEWNPPSNLVVYVPTVDDDNLSGNVTAGEEWENAKRSSAPVAVAGGIVVEVDVAESAETEYRRWVKSVAVKDEDNSFVSDSEGSYSEYAQRLEDLLGESDLSNSDDDDNNEPNYLLNASKKYNQDSKRTSHPHQHKHRTNKISENSMYATSSRAPSSNQFLYQNSTLTRNSEDAVDSQGALPRRRTVNTSTPASAT